MKKLHLLLIASMLLTLMLTACQSNAHDNSKLNVATGILPIKAFVEQIGGDYVHAEALIPLGANPHNYQPTPSSMKFLSDASLYIYVGVPTENDNIVPKVKDFNDHISIINLQEALASEHPFLTGDEHEHESEAATDEHAEPSDEFLVFEAQMLLPDSTIGAYSDYDPHTWVSPKRAITMVHTIVASLSEADPEHADTFKKNGETLVDELTNLDIQIREKIQHLNQKTYLIYHSSYNYFAFDYGLSFVSIENAGKSPTIQDIQHAIDTAKAFDIHTLFYQNEFSVEQAKSISEQIDGNAIPLEPLSDDYFTSMKKLLDALN